MPILDGAMPPACIPSEWDAGSSALPGAGAPLLSIPAPTPVDDPGRFMSVAHRGGRATSFIPSVGGRAAPVDDLVAVLHDLARRESVASSAHVTVRTFLGGKMPAPLTVPLDGARTAEPDALCDVRRSVSYVGQQNYAGTVVTPTQWWAWRAVWCESFNERYNYLDLILERGARQVATQCMRLEWRFPSGQRTHVPDAFVLLHDGTRLLVDVTTTKRLEDPAARAVFALTAQTCAALGWEYEVRTELPLQRQRNLSFLRTFQSCPPALVSRARAALNAVSLPSQIHIAAKTLGDGDLTAGLQLVWVLLAAGDIHCDLSLPLAPDTHVRRGRRGTMDFRREWVVAP